MNAGNDKQVSYYYIIEEEQCDVGDVPRHPVEKSICIFSLTAPMTCPWTVFLS